MREVSKHEYVQNRVVYKPMSLAFNGGTTWFDEFAKAKMIVLSIKDDNNNARLLPMDANVNTYQTLDNFSYSGLVLNALFQVGIGITPSVSAGSNARNAIIIGIYFIY